MKGLNPTLILNAVCADKRNEAKIDRFVCRSSDNN